MNRMVSAKNPLGEQGHLGKIRAMSCIDKVKLVVVVVVVV